jgi:hypothetical protein
MFKRRVALVASAVTVSLCLLPTAPASAEPSAWWQVLTGSRPTNLWEPRSQVQQINAPATPFFLSVKGESAGAFNGPFPPATASNIQSALESIYGSGNVQVSGGPGGSIPLLVTWIGDKAEEQVSPVEIESPLAPASTKTLVWGGSGRLVLTITNLGDRPVDATSTPVQIIDELPDGVEATGVEGFAGAQDLSGPVDCAVETPQEVTCTFEGTLPSYEAIEVEILGKLTGSPPVVGEPGKVTISGGETPSASAVQSIEVSPEPTPFGIEQFSARAEEEGGLSTTQAGSHPFQVTTTIQLKSGRLLPGKKRKENVIEQPALPRNFRFSLPAGLVGNVSKMAQCKMADFLSSSRNVSINDCPAESAVGVVSVTASENNGDSALLGFIRTAIPLFNLPPSQGEPARFGFTVVGDPIVIDTAVDPDNGYRIIATVNNATQLAAFLSSSVSIWGTPGDPRHDSSRGWNCTFRFEDLGPCERPAGLGEVAFLRQPVSCVTPFDFRVEAEPWNVPLGTVIEERSFNGGTQSGCNQVPFKPSIEASPTSRQAGGSSGLDFQLSMPNSGLQNPKAKAAEGQAKRVEVTLPQGVTANPSQAEGLAACSPAEYARETASSLPGQGCPEASKIGSVNVTTPLLEEEAKGAVYVASPYDNPFNSLLALYLVAKIPERGILVKQAGKVELNPQTGQLVTTFDNLPQIPFETFNLNFFGGNRAPLVMPAKCGTYDIVAKFTPWHASNPDNPLPSEVISKTSSFAVDRGTNGGPCPSGMPPFKPGFSAGTINNAAGAYSPFTARLTRSDGEQEFSRFSMKLPPGVIGKLAGVQICSEAAIAAARGRTGPSGGQEELQGPSCPAASQIGRTLVGAGVGPELSFAPGKLYLAGPYQGSKLSIVAITTAKVGPFDLGTVVIRQALRVNPETAEVSTDGAASDPIPHILQGIVVHARDIRVYVDRPEFVLNPTSCERMTAASTVLGSGLDFGSFADDQAVDVSAPFQAADCASLGFKPKLSLRLLGGTKRTDTPRLRAILTARKGDANIGRAQVTLPRSAFLEQAHIRTVCTRVQFRAGGGNGERCPKGSIYGRARAISPLLDEVLKGPVFLRSSDNELPDLVAALHSPKVDINLVGRIDSLNGRIRNTFEAVPDAPVKKFVLEMQGGRKGLIVNSTNLCKGKHRAIANFKGQNGRRHLFTPLVKAKCGGKQGTKGDKRKQR